MLTVKITVLLPWRNFKLYHIILKKKILSLFFAIGMMILTFYLTLKLDSEFFIASIFYVPVGLFGLFAKSKTLHDCFYGLKH